MKHHRFWVLFSFHTFDYQSIAIKFLNFAGLLMHTSLKIRDIGFASFHYFSKLKVIFVKAVMLVP